MYWDLENVKQMYWNLQNVSDVNQGGGYKGNRAAQYQKGTELW